MFIVRDPKCGGKTENIGFQTVCGWLNSGF